MVISKGALDSKSSEFKKRNQTIFPFIEVFDNLLLHMVIGPGAREGGGADCGFSIL